MRKIFISILLFSFCLPSYCQKKPFFYTIDMMLNIHVGNSGIQKNSWPELFKNQTPAYTIDTFHQTFDDRRCIIFPFLSTSASAGVRVAKYLFPTSENKLVKERVEWRSGLFVGTKLQSTSWYTTQDYSQQPPVVPYRYHELQLSYRRFWIDYSNQVVYKVPSWLFRKFLKYYGGTGIGITYDANSSISENRSQYLVSQSGGSFSITRENTSYRSEKAKGVTSLYLNVTTGAEIKCTDKIYLLFEGNYQGYIKSFSLKERLYREGGYLSAIFRYRF